MQLRVGVISEEYGIYTLYAPHAQTEVLQVKNFAFKLSLIDSIIQSLYTCFHVPFLSQTDERGTLEVHCNLQVKEVNTDTIST